MTVPVDLRRPTLGSAATVLLLMALPLTVAAAQDQTLVQSSQSAPIARFDLTPARYQGLSQTARLSNQTNLSLDFVDQRKVLLTFNPKGLLNRRADCPPTHEDHLIRALILDLHSGKVIQEDTWYLHDYKRYLWPLGSGRFLLRILNSLYIVDASLHRRLLLNSPDDLLWVNVTSDSKQIILATAENDNKAKKNDSGSASAKRVIRVGFLDTGSLALQRTVRLRAATNLEASSAGFADIVRKQEDVWLVRFGPTEEGRHNIARVRSHCAPDIFFPGVNTFLIGRCSSDASIYSVSAFTVTGRRLWRQHWSQHRYAPTIARSEDNSRFAVSTATVKSDPAGDGALPDDEDEEKNVDHDLVQHIEVLETASGNPVFSTDVSPVFLSGLNFSLSPDGRHMAIVRDSGLEIYDLPQMSEAEQAKYTAVKADTPGLYVVPSQLDASSRPGLVADSDEGEEAGYATAQVGGEAANANPPLSLVTKGNPSETAKAPAVQVTSASPAPPAGETTNAENSHSSDVLLPTFRAVAQAVVVDVVVTDNKNHPVKGLKLEDFQLFEDGKKQNIKYFQEFSGAQAVQGPVVPPPSPDKLPANVFTNHTNAPNAGSVTVLLLDFLNTPLADQRYAHEQLIEFLRHKPKDLQFALFALGRNLRLIQGFTPDESRLITSVNGKKGATQGASWLEANGGFDSSINSVARLAQTDPTTWQSVLQRFEQIQAEQKVTDTDSRVETTMEALASLARYLAAIPGRKNLLWLSGSFPINIAPSIDLQGTVSENRNYLNKIRKAANLLTAAQVAVYPIDMRGNASNSLFSASNEKNFAPTGIPIDSDPFHLSPNGAVPGGISGASPVVNLASPNQLFAEQLQKDMDTRTAEHRTMDQIAADTGGKAFYNTNGIERAIATAIDQGSNYYTISYSPANKKYDSGFRKIKISSGQKEYRLNYRCGYFADDPSVPDQESHDLSRDLGAAAMQQGSPQSREIVFAARVVPLGMPTKVNSDQGGKLVFAVKKDTIVEVQHYNIDYAVDSSDLRFRPTDQGTQHGVLRFMVTAFDDEGRLMAGSASTATSDLKPETYKDAITGGFRAHQEVDVPVQAVSLRLGVEDALSRHLGTLELPLPLSPPPDLPRIVKHSLPEIEPD